MATGNLLILGYRGMLGADMLRLYSQSRNNIFGADIDEVDITEPESISSLFKKTKPETVINCAGYTDVDGCERNPELAFETNARGAGNIARACRDSGSFLVHMSTDYIFDGGKGAPYIEEDSPHPISKYAESKYQGEKEIIASDCSHLIIRSTWIFGFHPKSFPNFVLRKISDGGNISIYSEQCASPTYTIDLAEAIMNLLDAGAEGVVHFVNGGYCNRLEFTNEIFDIMGYDKSLIVPAQCKPPTWLALRPAMSALNTDKYTRLTGKKPRSWKTALRDFLERQRS